MVSKAQLRKALGIKCYYIKFWDIDKHGSDCGCGECDSNGKSYGVGIFPHDSEEPLNVLYAACEEDAFEKAKLQASYFYRGTIIKPPEED